MEPYDRRPCGCFVDDESRLHYCPMHDAAGDLVRALRRFFSAAEVSTAFASLQDLRGILRRIDGGDSGCQRSSLPPTP